MTIPLLSIVVPTKNRYKYLKYLISFFNSIESDQIELIIQDNSDDNGEIKNFLSTIIDSRVKYHYVSKSLPISLNSDYAINNSCGEYVCYLGDDDGFTSNILDAVECMRQHDADAAIFAIPHYLWPDCKGSLFWDWLFPFKIKKASGRITLLDSRVELIKVLKDGAYKLGQLPKVYHGIVTRKSLDKIYEKYGSYFPGASPDMANAVSLALNDVKTIHIDYPFLIGGTCKVRMKGNENGDFEKDFSKLPFLPADIEANWDKRIPKIWTGQTIYTETIIKTLERSGNSDLIHNINFSFMYISFIRHYKKNAKMVYKLLNISQLIALGYNFIVFTMKYMLNKRKANETYALTINKEVSDIIEYIQIVEQVNGDFLQSSTIE